MEWNNEIALNLIDEYEKHPILWNAKHLSHFSRHKKVDAWEIIATNLKINVVDAKQKMNSLLGSHRREKAKGKKAIGTGKGRKEIYVSKWFAFKRMEFLLDKDEPVATVDTENSTNDGEEEECDNFKAAEESQEDDEFQVSPDPGTPGQPFVSPVTQKPKKKKKFEKIEDPRLEEAYTILKQSIAVPPESSDSCSVYGTHVANKLRNYSLQVRTEVEHAINNILYAADKGQYNIPATSLPAQYFPNPIRSNPESHLIIQYPSSHSSFPSPSSPSPSSPSPSSSNNNSSSVPYIHSNRTSHNPTPNNNTSTLNLDMPDVDFTNL